MSLAAEADELHHLHELIVQYSLRRSAGGVQKRAESLTRAVVHAIRPHDVQLLQVQVLLHGSQSLNLQA